MIKLFFIYKNRSSEEFGLKIVSINNLSSPARKTDTKEVPGRKTGDLIIDYGSYGNFQLKIVCTLNAQKNKNIEDVVTELKYWLQGNVGFDDLYISKTRKNYKACCINKLDIAEVFKNFGECTLLFECQPFKEFTDNELIVLTEATQIYNQYFESQPYMKIYGSGDVTIYINNQTLVLKGITDYIEVDSEEMNCYKGTTNANDQMYTDFPVLCHGENTISWVGNITKIELNPRWCSL